MFISNAIPHGKFADPASKDEHHFQYTAKNEKNTSDFLMEECYNRYCTFLVNGKVEIKDNK